jgi:hypothetical protein
MPAYDLNSAYTDVTIGFITDASKTLSGSFERIVHCLQQLSDAEVWWRPRPEMNAIGNLLLHLCGNVEQWILAPIENRTSDRNRPAEFAQRELIAKSELQARLSTTVALAAGAIRTLDAADQLLAARRVQGHNTTILAAIFHSVAHFEGHTQEIICMTRQIKGDAYQFLWTPRTPEQISGPATA